MPADKATLWLPGQTSPSYTAPDTVATSHTLPKTMLTRPRQRRSKPKSRGGCKTCKIRRVKCGEERPCCLRCRSTGRVCDGYLDMIHLASTSTDDAGDTVVRWEYPPSHTPDVPSTEQEALYSFREYLLDSSHSAWDKDVWHRLVLPLSTTESAIRKAVVALSLFTKPDGAHNTLALQSYSQAIKALQTRVSTSTRSRHVVLVACLLFVVIEFVQHGWQQAHFQLSGGLSIIKEMQQSTKSARKRSASEEDLGPLVYLFERLDKQMSLFTSTRVQLNRALHNARMAALPAEVHFRSLTDATRSHNLQLSAMRELVCEAESQRYTPASITAPIYAELEIQLGRQLLSLNRWGAAMEELITRLQEIKDRRAAKQLLMSHLCCKLMVSNALSDGREVYYDRYMPEFELIISLGDECLRSIDSPRKRKIYSLDMGIIAPSYYTALKCRDPRLRRRAVGLLRSYNGQEGAWDSQTMADLAEKVLMVEERGLEDPQSAADVPERNRLWRAWFDLELGGDTLYCMRRAWEGSGAWIEYEVYVGERTDRVDGSCL